MRLSRVFSIILQKFSNRYTRAYPLNKRYAGIISVKTLRQSIDNTFTTLQQPIYTTLEADLNTFAQLYQSNC